MLRWVFLSLWLAVAVSRAAIVYIANYGDGTGSVANFNLAYADADAGDTIQFPTGTVTWSSGVTIDKGVSIAGNGVANTKIYAHSSLTVPLFTVTGFTYSSLMRITGIYFNVLDSSQVGRSCINVTLVTLDQLRIDHCEFHFGYEQVNLSGAKGVVDHNYFYNGLKNVGYTAGSVAQAAASWTDLAMGTGNALFIETNYFIANADYQEAFSQERIATQNGGKLVVRYNNFVSTAIPSGINITPIEIHGSAAGGVANGYWQIGTGARRGQATVEIYNNTATGVRMDYLAILRGSASLIHTNTLDTTANNPRVLVREEEQTDPQWVPNRLVWPAEDQVHNTFAWDNTLRLNGTPNAAYFEVVAGSETFIQENRDFFLHAPQSSGGSESFTGAGGASGSAPTDGVTWPTLGTMTFSAAGANAYYPYTPYQYPHPLVAETSGGLSGKAALSGKATLQ